MGPAPDVYIRHKAHHYTNQQNLSGEAYTFARDWVAGEDDCTHQTFAVALSPGSRPDLP